MENSNAPAYQGDREREAVEQYIPEIEAVVPVNGEQAQGYLRELKSYLISGKKTSQSLTPEVNPIQFALHQRGAYPNTDYPVFYDSENDDLFSLYPTLGNLVAEHFDAESSVIIHKELPKLFTAIQHPIKEAENGMIIQQLLEEIRSFFQAIDLPEKDTAAFEVKIDKIQQDLKSRLSILFGFSGKTAFQMLNLQNKLWGDLKSAFLLTLKKVIGGLNELLSLQGDASSRSVAQMDFAADLISFDKIRAIAVSTVSSQIPKSRLNRLKSALQTLTTFQQAYAQRTTTIIASEAIIKSFDLERIFDQVQLEVTSENSCWQASIQSKKDTAAFAKTIAALRMGNLMIEQKYEEGLHDDYFDQFDLSYCTKEDLKYLPPIIVIEDSRRLMLQANDFLSLLSKNSFVKVLGVNLLADLFDLKDRDEPEYLELASMAIFRRNSYVFQGGIDWYSGLNRSYQKGLEFPGAVFWNILIPSGGAENNNAQYFALKAAVESRYFPRMEYEADGNHFENNQIDLQNNPAPDADFTTYEQQIKSPSGMESSVLAFTMAEFLAMDSELKEMLEIVPPVYQNANFIPFSEYLSQSNELLSGKIPFIWLVDDQNKLRQAAIPLYWIQRCRNRLEYWSFLRSISGINKAHLQDTIKASKVEWEKTKDAEIAALKSALQEQFEKERAGDLQQGISRMLYGLLDQEGNLENALRAISREEFKPKIKAQQEQAAQPDEQAKEEEEASVSIVIEQAWVESDECTSCRDCVDALPAVFKYNENKQAYVHDPKGGPFSQIVKAAEKCPARCIHPGVPQNKHEESLEQWIKRAEKFN